MSADCLFCKILRKEIPSTKVYEDELCYAFPDIAPKAYLMDRCQEPERIDWTGGRS